VENSNGALVLTPNEVRKLLKCSRGTIYEAIRQDSIPHIHLGRKILIPKAALLKMLENAGGDGTGKYLKG
jgi:excisionase family DNA binding protein